MRAVYSHTLRVSESRWLVSLGVLFYLCALAGCGAPPSLPPIVAQTSGTLALDGVSAPVRIVRDRWGIPHIYAESRDDLFFAQGFVQAQDRLFQMDLWRRSVQGRLSQVLGANFIERDAMTRRVQYRGDLDAEWASYGPDAKAIATAFVRGVNAWVALARERPPEEFALAGWTPEFWMPVDLLNRTDLFVESRAAIDFATWRPSGTWGPASAGPETIPVLADALRRVGAPPFFVGLAADIKAVRLKPDTTSGVDSHDAGRGVGRQADQPFHVEHPSRRYLTHLHAPGWNVIGATAPWMPGVAIGHDERAAWDATSGRVEPPSVLVVGVNSDNAHQVRDGDRWIDTQVVKDLVVVKRRKAPFAYESDYTAGGVIIATDRDRHIAFVMRWRGVEAGAIPALHALVADRTSLPPLPGASLGSVAPGSSAVFTHPLGITTAARSRFNIGPMTTPASRAAPFQVRAASDSDQWTAMNAPGQSESPDSAHFKDLATEWAAGRPIPLAFSDRAVESAAETTLILAPRRP